MRKDKQGYNDIFIPHDKVGSGHLKVAGEESILSIVDTSPLARTDQELVDYHGVLNGGGKASLLGCVTLGSSQRSFGDITQSEATFFPHYVLIGPSYVGSQDQTVSAIHYHFENVERLVIGQRTFGTIYPRQDEFRSILDADNSRVEALAKEQGWPRTETEVAVGEQPILQYYSGVWEVAKCTSKIGTIALRNQVSHKIGRTNGVRIDNNVVVSLEFVSPTTVGKAIASLRKLHSFFELCLGGRQRYVWIEAEVCAKCTNPEKQDNRRLQVYWSYSNARDFKKSGGRDVLVDGASKRSEFESMIGAWMDGSNSLRNARSRFASVFLSSVYGIDRIVGAANMFDVLPASHVPAARELDEQTLVAARECRTRFKALPNSQAREVVLLMLGRIERPSLLEKIRHRANILINADGVRFRELHVPCKEAVVCRNHYVHGGEATFDYEGEFTSFAFLVDTLEFVFGASDLIELGWDFVEWQSQGAIPHHSFGRYILNYEDNIQRLTKLLGT